MMMGILTETCRTLTPILTPRSIAKRATQLLQVRHLNKGSKGPTKLKSMKKWHRPLPYCAYCFESPKPKPCFDLSCVQIRIANYKDMEVVRTFLYTYLWPREPSVNSLYIPMTSFYLNVLTDRFCSFGDVYMAIENYCGRRRLVGVLVGQKVLDSAATEFVQWASWDTSTCERNHKFFWAHCLRMPNLHKRYHATFVYDLSMIATTYDVQGQGVGTLLMLYALEEARSMRFPCVQVIATSAYQQRLVSRIKHMQSEWSMQYKKYLDTYGNQVMFPRRPHNSVVVYSRPFTQKLAEELPCLPPV